MRRGSLLLGLAVGLLAAAACLCGGASLEETERARARWRREERDTLQDDEDMLMDASGDDSSGEGSGDEKTSMPVVYRVNINFTSSIAYDERMENYESEEFQEVSRAVIDALESEFANVAGEQIVTVVLIRLVFGHVMVDVDVQSEGNADEAQVAAVLWRAVRAGDVANYRVSTQGYSFRRIGHAPTEAPRACGPEEFACGSGECIPLDYACDRRMDCEDDSDESNCAITAEPTPPPAVVLPPAVVPGLPEHPPSRPVVRPVVTPPPPPSPPTPPPPPPPPLTPPPPPPPTRPQVPHTAAPVPPPSVARPCRVEEAVCGNGQCVPRDYLCDGEKDCTDGSDEMACATASPCEPNEFRCQNGRCALKLWRCDGDNDCGDNSDEDVCPTRGPYDRCAPEQFSCASRDQCIPASYQCDEERDCRDGSDENDCRPPQVVTPPADMVMVSRGDSVTLTCEAVGVPTPLITWRLNWGHVPASSRVSMSSENGQGVLVLRDVKDSDQGAYTCEAINAKGMIFGIPDAVLVVKGDTGPCGEGQYNSVARERAECLRCFCFGVTNACESTRRHRSQITLRFTEPDDQKGVNVTMRSSMSQPLLAATQIMVDGESGYFQLVDLSRHFRTVESFWELPGQFLGNKIGSYGGSLRFKIRYSVGRVNQLSVPLRPDVLLKGGGRTLAYRPRSATQAGAHNDLSILFIEENWQHEGSGRAVTREELLMTLVNLEGILIKTVYDDKMVSVGLADIAMDTAITTTTSLGPAYAVEECRCPPGYTGLSCEQCAPGFSRVHSGLYLGTCAGCSCHGHATACDERTGECLSCQHNTEGARCDRCRAGFVGDPTRGTPTDCQPCPCPFTGPPNRFSQTCFLDSDGRPTCDACAPGYVGRRCDRCAPGYEGNPTSHGGTCQREEGHCDRRGSLSLQPIGGQCLCKPHVVGSRCDECEAGAFHLSDTGPNGCLSCFCMGLTRQCTSSSWSRDVVRADFSAREQPLYQLTELASGRTFRDELVFRGDAIFVYSFNTLPATPLYWALPDRFRGDKVTAYGGELRVTVRYEASPGATAHAAPSLADVLLQGNDISLEHRLNAPPQPGASTPLRIPMRESSWRRADGQPCSREHLLMALADVAVLLVRATYTDNTRQASIKDMTLDVAVPMETGLGRAYEVEECICPTGYRGTSCQDCAFGFTRSEVGLYLGMCVRCDCQGHSNDCDAQSGLCLSCQHNTDGPRCDRCKPGFYGDPSTGGPDACRPCPCPPIGQSPGSCYRDSDGQATCTTCPPGHTGRFCDRCAEGYSGNPQAGQPCTEGCRCDPRGSAGDQCDSHRGCQCKVNVEGRTCDTCRPGTFHLHADNPDGCLACFCMGVTGQCASSGYYRHTITMGLQPGGEHGFALVNRARTAVVTDGLLLERVAPGRVTAPAFGQLAPHTHYWRLPPVFTSDKREREFARIRRAHKKEMATMTEDELRRDASAWQHLASFVAPSRVKRSQVASARPLSLSRPLARRHRDSSRALLSFHFRPPSPLPRRGCNCERCPPAPPCSSCSSLAPPVLLSPAFLPRPQGSDMTDEQLRIDSDVWSLFPSFFRPRHPASESPLPGAPGLANALPEALPDDANPNAIPNEPPGAPPHRHAQGGGRGGGKGGGGGGDGAAFEDNNFLDLFPVFSDAGSGWPEDFPARRGRESGGRAPPPPPRRIPLILPPPFPTPPPPWRSSWSSSSGSPVSTNSRRTQLQSKTHVGQFPSLLEAAPHFDPLTSRGNKSSNEIARVHEPLTPRGARPHEVAKYELVYRDWSLLPRDEVFYWRLPDYICPQQVTAYGGKLRYTLSYSAGPQGSPIPDADLHIIGNDITLSAYHQEQLQPGETRTFEIPLRESYWQRLDGQPATREHLLMALADVDAILVRASFSTDTTSASIGDVSLDTAVPGDTGGARALQVEECSCPAAYTGLSCQDCAPGYTRTGGGLYLGLCEMCDCNGHTDSCDPETASCSSCQHHTTGSSCERCEPGYYGDATQGTPEDCQPCACPLSSHGNQFSPSCEGTPDGGYRCTACQPGYTGRYCDQCAPGYLGNPRTPGQRCVLADRTPLLIRIVPDRIVVATGDGVTLRCQATGASPVRYDWARADGQAISERGQMRLQGQELSFQDVQASDGGVYVCTCQSHTGSNSSQATITVTARTRRPITVRVEEPIVHVVRPGGTVTFICTAVSTLPAYTLVWTRDSDGMLPAHAQDFNGILTIVGARSTDAGSYTCTGSNMLDMDTGRALLHVEVSAVSPPLVVVEPASLTVGVGEKAEFRCSASGNPQPVVEWTGGPGGSMALAPGVRVLGPMLTIPAAQRAHEAEYACRAHSAGGQAEGRAVLYVRGTGSPPVVEVHPSHLEAVEGENVKLYCRATGDPKPTLTWRRQDGALPAEALTEVTGVGTLVLPAVRASHAGAYVCVASSAAGAAEARIELAVRPGGAVPLLPPPGPPPTTSPGRRLPVVQIDPPSATVPLGGSVALRCAAHGGTEARVSWERAHGQLASNQRVSGSVLHIVGASAEDAGDFTCTALDPHGRPLASSTVAVAVSHTGGPGSSVEQSRREEIPRVKVQPSSRVTVQHNDNVQFSCQVQGGAQPVSVEWRTTNEQPFPENVQVSGSELRVVRAQHANQGTFLCHAANAYGVTSSTATLVVQGPPSIAITPKGGPVRVRLGASLTLECSGMGHPRPSVHWRVADLRPHGLPHAPPTEGSALLQLTSVRARDAGTYACVARNDIGSTEQHVEVVVEGPGGEGPPLISLPEPSLVVIAGGTATLRCTVTGSGSPVITWSKLRSPLPWQHSVEGGVLTIPHVGQQDSGAYICNATSRHGNAEAYVSLEVEVPPYATCFPARVEVREGERLRVQCVAHGTPPLRLEWSRDGGPLAPHARAGRDGVLLVERAGPGDAGVYRVRVTNRAGAGEASATVVVRGASPVVPAAPAAPAVKVTPSEAVKAPGSVAEFSCRAAGEPGPAVEWTRRGGAALPARHTVSHGTLRLEDLRKEDEGEYVCRARNAGGEGHDSARLSVHGGSSSAALPVVSISVRTAAQTVAVGARVEFDCHAPGEPLPAVRWDRVDAALPPHAVLAGGLLVLETARPSDAGIYRCTATNAAGSVESRVQLYVQVEPQISVMPRSRVIAPGGTASFTCHAAGLPAPQLSWNKVDGPPPSDFSVERGVLTIRHVGRDDGGTYACRGDNGRGATVAQAVLVVREVLRPYFPPGAGAYVSLPAMKGAYKRFEARVTFRPDTADALIFFHGLVLYNGQKQGSGVDFLSFGLVGGRPEFRFDVGSGMAVIRYPMPLELGEYHTVTLRRNLTEGSLTVNNEAPVVGSSQGKFQGLDLNEEMYVGGVPSFSRVTRITGIKTGFTGCVREMELQGEQVNFLTQPIKSVAVRDCPTCQDGPCQNEGVCHPSEEGGYECECPPGYTGTNCELPVASSCHPGSCSDDATCVSSEEGPGFTCRCHLGKSGETCMQGELITVPSFSGASFVSLPPLSNVQKQLTLSLEFRPLQLDGLLLYSGARRGIHDDFVSVALANGHAELRYHLGSGTAVLRSPERVQVGRWHRLAAERVEREGWLRLDEGRQVSARSPGRSQGLNLRSPLYLGGVPSGGTLHAHANVSGGLHGCIAEVLVNGKRLDVSYSFVASRAVEPCRGGGAASACDHRNPCRHGGSCVPLGEYEVQCVCTDGYQGERCEERRSGCSRAVGCMNGGTCVGTRCVCPMGYHGDDCHHASVIQHAASFAGDGYIALPEKMFVRSMHKHPETMQLEVKTLSPEGLLVWQGVAANEVGERTRLAKREEAGENGKGKDFVSLGLRDGRLVFSYQLGSGEASITSRTKINDGRWHNVTAVREGRLGWLRVDHGAPVRGQSGGTMLKADVKGSVFLGGAPDTETLTGGHFSSGLRGCMRNVVLANEAVAGGGAPPHRGPRPPIDLAVHAEGGLNAVACDDE
ncbi:basement membrane-specific heparan sulfate proteoglycan core protein isoform X5 [Petromyzon marinus]|uniref:basement membrane-specific heparan sulfate proteoglycan core protein isoform X5 n=1 Tax=Petromyzon marinus TaxID=7757 RepID=UPI003F70DE15